MSNVTPKTAAVYIDGCNLYHGMRAGNLRRCYWLDLAGLSHKMVLENKTLVRVAYFTARVVGDQIKNRRHSTYIEALQAHGGVEVVEGFYQQEPFECRNCRNRRNVAKEKQTDTNIATEMVADAYTGLWEVAILVSGDADLVPPIRRIRRAFPTKQVLVGFPPLRVSGELSRAATGSFHLNAAMLAGHQLPDTVMKGTIPLTRPDYWT